MDPRVLAVLGRGVVPLDTPVLRADDLGATRGDGVFETMHVRGGTAWLLDAHLRRMAASAQRLDLSLPSATELVDLTEAALGAWPSDREATLKLVCTRGPEEAAQIPGPGFSGAPLARPSVFALITPIAVATVSQRRNGIKVATASLGMSAAARAEAPWLLGGVKSLSYAANMAALRWAAGQGCDDVLYLSSEGQVLEGPTSTVVWAKDGTLYTVPDETGILPGITAAYLFDHADALGLATSRRCAVVEDLLAADGVWLCSSGRGIARVVELDGKPVADSGLTTALRDVLGFSLD
jgi:4-amino-4-deoxychorismate lyase